MRRALLIGGLLLVVLLTLAVVGLRGSRGNFTPPTVLKPNLVQVEAGHACAFAARVGSNVVLFDAGPDPEGHGIDAMLGLLKAQRGDVHDIFLTHGHADHIAAVPLFPQARVWGGSADVPLAAATEPPEALAARLMGLVMSPPVVNITQAMDSDGQTSVGEKILVRGLSMPGHTSGSMGYLYDGVLFVGDALQVRDDELVETLSVFNPHPQQARDAVVRVAQILASTPIDRVCAAHGGCTPAGEGSKQLEAFVHSLPAPPSS